MAEILNTFTNSKDGVSAIVTKIDLGYSVTLRDDDADEYVPVSFIFPSLDAAIAKAKSIV